MVTDIGFARYSGATRFLVAKFKTVYFSQNIEFSFEVKNEVKMELLYE